MSKSPELDLPKVIFIAGYGRSGSTILDIVLGNHKKIVSLGEAAILYQKDAYRKLCSCGKDIDTCPIWGKIMGSQLVSMEDQSVPAHDLVDSIESIRGLIPILLGGSLKSARRASLERQYQKRLRLLFTSIKCETSASTVIDSSKTAWRSVGRPYGLSELCGLDVRVIHLIRDGRGVMWSTMKGSDRDLERNQARKSPWRGYQKVLNWAVVNLLTLLVLRKLPKQKVMRVHYEEFVDHPHDVLERVESFIGIDTSELRERIERKQQFKVGHLLRGNRIARQKETVEIVPDYSWKTELTLRDLILYWLVLWPVALLLRKT